MKKLLIKILLVIMMVTATFFVGCQCGGDGDGEGSGSQGGPGTPPPAPSATIELKAEKTILTVGEYSKVTPTNYDTVEGQALVFASSNPDVVKVYSDGTIEAISEDKAIISVTYGEAKAQIIITSTFAGFVPELMIDGLLTRNLSNVDTDQINPYIVFNERRFGLDEGLSVQYTSTNTNLLTVNSSGLVTGITGAKGDATVVVKASWRGFDGSTVFSLQKEIAYHVDFNTLFMINADTARSYDIYTKAEFGGQNYENEIDFVCTATYGEETIESSNITVTVANEDMISFANNKLTGKGFGTDGKTNVTLSFVKDDTTYSKVVSINVIRPIASYADRIKYFSSFTGNYKDEADSYKDKSVTQKVFGETEIVDAYQGDTRLAVENGNIIGVKGNFDSVADVTLRIGTQTERYDVSLDVYTKVIQNAKDIEDTFNINTYGKFVTGYCEMINDVDMKNYEFKHEGYYHATVKDSSVGGFRGVFNGNGYTISNYQMNTASQGGMFLYIQAYNGNNPVIKNVGFTDIKFGSRGGTVLALGVTAPTQFENIYIKTAEETGLVKGALLPGYSEVNVKMKNIFIEVPNAPTINPLTDGSDGTENMHVLNESGARKPTGNVRGGYGSLFGQVINVVTEKSASNFNSVFVVSPMPLTYHEGDDYNFTDATFIKNYNNSEDKDPTLTVVEKDSNGNAKKVIRHNPYYYQYGINQTTTWDNKPIPTNSTFYNYEKYSVQTGAYYYKTMAELVAGQPDLSSFATDESECWIIKDGVPTWRSSDKDSYYTTENGKLNSDTIILNEEKKNTTIGVTNYTDVDFAISNAVSNNENITATVNGDGKTITLNVVDGYEDWDNAKDVIITVTYTDGDEKTLEVKVKLTSVIQKINDEVLFSAQDGVFHGNNLVGHGEIAEAFQVKEDGGLSTLTLTKEGYLLGATTNISNGFKDVGYITIRVITKDGLIYQFNKVKAYTGILTSGQHLKWFTMEIASDKNQGHYIVANNINADKVAVPHAQYPNADSPYNQVISTANGGFQGIFDGQGYAIDKMFSFRNGLFGRIFNDEQGATEIKNVAFTNVGLNPYDGTLDDGKKHASGPLFARFTPDTVLDENYVAKYQTVISNVYVQYAVPNIGPGYQGSVVQGLFNSYCEHNLVNDGPEDTPSSSATKIPLSKRGAVVSYKLVDCFIDYSNINSYIRQKDVGGSGGGLIVSGGSGAVMVDTKDTDTTADDEVFITSEEIKNSRYDNLMVASEYPIAVKRTSISNPEIKTNTKILDSTLGSTFYVEYASTMNGKTGYYGWKWLSYYEIKDNPDYATAVQDGYTPSDLAEQGIDYKLCGQMYQFHETITFTGNATVDNDITKGTFFYTNINQYATLDDMATAYTANDNLYDGYDTAYWKVVDGKLTWKGANA